MTATGALFTAIALLVVAAGVVILVAVVRHAPRSRAAEALARADLDKALADGRRETGPGGSVAASIAARHGLDFATARAMAERARASDPYDGEALIELALVYGYSGDLEDAEAALVRAQGLRPDLIESITLHRAWIARLRGDGTTARRLFDEVEAPLETKLRTDLGSGDVAFADWFFQAGELWRAAGNEERAAWAIAEARRTVPSSRLFSRVPGS